MGRKPLRLGWPGRSGHQRVVLAFALSLLIHAALVTVGLKVGVRPPHALPQAEKALQWVDVVPVVP